MLERKLHNVAVIGAGGKMGRGISLLLLQLISRRQIVEGLGPYQLVLIDSVERALDDVRGYLRTQLAKYAGREVPDMEPSIFVDRALELVTFSTEMEDAKEANLVFEAVIEDMEIKKAIFSYLNEVCDPSTYFLTNTSSLPIGLLDVGAQLSHRIIGFHFYNPPPVQRLVELIYTEETSGELKSLAMELGEALHKVIIPSRDVAGFIGNGHFIRELAFASELRDELANDFGNRESIYLINRITQDYLLRPMGVFQLADYVGLDVCQKIMRIMTRHIEGAELSSSLINEIVSRGTVGGQNPDGTQRNGILQYDRNTPVGIFSLSTGHYEPIGPIVEHCEAILGDSLSGDLTWKGLLKDSDKEAKLQAHFQHLYQSSDLGAKLARRYLEQSRDIAQALVDDGVAEKIDDVNGVLKYGFYHLYGAVNPFTPRVGV